jgi:multiple sugar transport system permease protein
MSFGDGTLATTPAFAHTRRVIDADRLWRWGSLAPAFLLMLALGALPLLNLLVTSFNDVSWSAGTSTWTFRGIQHYLELPADPLVTAGIVNTLLFAVGAVAGQVILGLVLALLVSRISRGKVFFRAFFILPILIPGIVIGAIWKLLFNFDFGLFNQALRLIGIAPQDWLGDSATALLSVIAVDIWHWTPFCFLLLLAGIESLPQDVFEASRIDGASRRQEFWHITLPLLFPTIIVTAAFRLVLALKVFDEVYLLTGGGPGTATQVISFTLYQRFFIDNKVGYGAALAVAVIFFVSLVLVFGLNARRREAAA